MTDSRGMSHCHSVAVQIEGRPQILCTLVPGNRSLAREVEAAQLNGTLARVPTQNEVRRAVECFLQQGSNGPSLRHEREHPR